MTADVRRGGTPYAPPIRPAVPLRSAGRLGLWIAALALLLGLPLLAASGPAGAQSTTTAPSSGEPAAEEAVETTVQGTIINRGGTRDRGDDEPVEGVEITVAEEGGAEIETATTDEEGAWAVVVPGPGSYTVTLDPDTLPDDVGIAEGENEVTVAVLREGDAKSAFFNGVGAREREATTTFERFLQLAFTGVRFGLIIGITSIGLSLIFGTTGLTNFAHGEMVTFGGIIAWYANVSWGIQMIPATVLAVIAGALLALVLERGLWQPLRHRGMALLSMMVVSIGLAIVLRYSFQLVFGASPRVYADYQNQVSYEVGPVRMAPRDLWTIGLIIITLMAVAFLLQRTKIGKAMRAVSDNRDLAASSGIDVDRVILFVWGLGGALAALGGVLFALNERISFNSGFNLLLLMFAGITLGGLGTAYGALVGSFIVGMFIQISTLWISPELKNVSALVVLILVLLVRPQGILGQKERVG